MSTPLSAVYRVQFDIQPNLKSRKVRIYCAAVASGDSTGYDLIARTGHANQGLSACADAYFTLCAGLYEAANTVFGQAVLQQLIGIAWIPLASYSTAVVATSISTNKIGVAAIMVNKDTAFHEVKSSLPEAVFDPPSKTNTPGGFGATTKAYIDGFTNPFLSGASDPYWWARGRSNLFINSFLSLVVDTNDRYRRDRGLV